MAKTVTARGVPTTDPTETAEAVLAVEEATQALEDKSLANITGIPVSVDDMAGGIKRESF